MPPRLGALLASSQALEVNQRSPIVNIFCFSGSRFSATIAEAETVRMGS